LWVMAADKPKPLGEAALAELGETFGARW